MCSDYLDKIDHFSLCRDVPSLAIRRPLIERPRVSVIVPTYNRAALLSETLDSILAQQGFDAFEIVVVDNNAERDDETEKLMARYADPRIAYFKNQKNIGMFGNWNRAIELSRGEWIAMIHDDDMLMPQYLETVMCIVRRKPEIGLLVVGREWLVSAPSAVATEKCTSFKLRAFLKAFFRFPKTIYDAMFPLKRLSLKEYILSYPHGTPGWFFRRDVAMELGGFDPKYSPCADYYFSAKCCLYSSVYYFLKKLFIYRIAENESLRFKTRLDFIRLDYQFRSFMLAKLGFFARKFGMLCLNTETIIRLKQTIFEYDVAEQEKFLRTLKIRPRKISDHYQAFYFYAIKKAFLILLFFVKMRNKCGV